VKVCGEEFNQLWTTHCTSFNSYCVEN